MLRLVALSAALLLVTAQKSEAPPKINCEKLQDGIYVRDPTACINSFWKCANGRAFRYSCPHNLFFDIQTANCEYKHHVPTCGGTRPTTATPAKTNNVAISYGVPIAPVGPVVVPPAPVNVQPAAPGYGPPPVPVAPVVPATVAPAPVNVQPVTQAPYYVVPPAPVNVQTTTRAPVDFDCSNKASGFYTKTPCGSTFYHCNGGHAFQLSCSPGTGYDVTSQACEWLSECGKPKTTTTTAAPAPVNVQPTVPASTECVSRPDGAYPRGTCQTSYLLCANGNAYSQSCPAGLVFGDGTCTYLADCLNPTTTAPPAPVNVQPTVPAVPVNPYAPVQTTAAPAPVNVQPVTQAPYAPVQTTAAPAPVNVQPVTQAPYQVQTTAAPAPVNVQPVPVNPYAPVQTTAAPAPVNVQPTTTAAPINFDCSGKPDGYYTNQNCGPAFYTCIGGQVYQTNCPAGTGYDAVSQSCEWLSTCGQPKPTTTTAAPAPVNVQPTVPAVPVNPYAPQVPQVQPTIPAAPIAVQPTTPAPVNFDCSGKQDGYYGQGCSSSYFSCAAGFAYAFQCPQGLQFSSQTGFCDYQSNIPECGGQLQTTAAPAPVNVQPTQPAQSAPAGPYAPAVPGPINVQPSVQTTTAAPEVNLCAKLQNGIYGKRCSRHYFVCSSNKTYEFTCPISYVYDPKSSQCAPREVVDICQPATTTAAPAPVKVQPTQAYNPYAPRA